MKQAERKKINKKRYVYPLAVSLHGVDGLYTLQSSHEEADTIKLLTKHNQTWNKWQDTFCDTGYQIVQS